MYLPSKINSKQITFFIVLVFLIVLPLRDFIQNLFVFLANSPALISLAKDQELDTLKEENLALKLNLKELEYLKTENEQLRKAFEFKVSKKVKLIGAEVIAFSPSAWRRIFFINKGKNEGIKKDAFAFDEDANLLGRILEVDESHSRLILINDPDFSISVFIGKNAFGLLKSNFSRAKVLYIDDASQIKLKDPVWLKIPSLGSPIEIGTVQNIKKNENSLFWDVEVALFAKDTFQHKVFLVQ